MNTMIFVLFRISVLLVLNYLLIYGSKYIDTLQLLEDISKISGQTISNIGLSYFIISFSVSLLTVIMVSLFKPFVEIYLLHYSRYMFYVLVSLISLSSVFIVFRVYGYSRLFVLLYVVASSIFLMLSKKFKNF